MLHKIGLIVVFVLFLASCSQAPMEESTPVHVENQQSTEQPQNLKEPEPSRAPQPDFDTFSLDSVQTVLPKDILREVSYYGIGGGSDCSTTTLPPYIDRDPIDSELMENNTMVTCGWRPGQKLLGRITYPDGAIVSHEIVTNEHGVGVLSFRPMLSDPEGVYQFEVSEDGVDLVSNAHFHRPAVPRAYELDAHTLLLHNFVPGEPVRLFMYSCNENQLRTWCESWDFEGWQEYRIGDKGDLTINAQVNSENYYIVSTDTLELNVWSLDLRKAGIEFIHINPETLSKTDEHYEASMQYRRCSANVQSGIRVTEDDIYAQVITSNGSTLKMYSNPRTDSRVKLEVKRGTILELDGDYSTVKDTYLPICFDGKIWWWARYYDKNQNYFESGYVIEYDNQGKNYIEQVNEKTVQEQAKSCGGLISRLSKGDKARVAFTDGSNMRIRAKPGFSEEILNKVPEGTLITILDGPKCADKSTWWRIRTENNLVGWMTEEQEGVYLLEPYP